MTDLPEIPGRYCECVASQPGNLDLGENPLKCYGVDCGRAVQSLGHQRKAYHFAMQRLDSGAEDVLLSMEMGTGKSKVVQAILDGRDIQLALILCPRRVIPVWPDEFKFHSLRDWLVVTPPLKATVATRAQKIAEGIMRGKREGRPTVVCVNYEAAWRPTMEGMLRDIPWEAIICDESHKLKSPTSKASKYLAKIGKGVGLRICGTGTPMPHSPLDIYGQMRFLDPNEFGTNFHRFRSRYAVMIQAEGPHGRYMKIVDWQNQEDLNMRWGRHAFICGEEVLDLPPYRHLGKDEGYSTVLEPKAAKAYKELERDFITWVREHPGDDGSVIVGDNALTKLLRLQQITSGWVKDDEGRMVRISTAKQELLDDVLSNLDVNEPVVVCCRFRHDLDTVREVCEAQGRTYAEISGRISETSDVYGLDGRTMREDIDVVAVQIQAGGVGIDLTRAAHVILYSVGYSLGDYLQFLKRTWRQGQTRAVTYYHLVVEGTKDEDVEQALLARADLVGVCITTARKAMR